MESQQEVQYFHFGRGIWQPHRGIVTAGVIPHERVDNMVHVAFAFCSPADQFRRRTEPPLKTVRETVEDPTEEHPDRTRTAQRQVTNPDPLPGGCDIVDARLGLVDNEKYPMASYTIDVPVINRLDPESGPRDATTYKAVPSVMHAVMALFNRHIPVEEKPQLWRDRWLVYGLPMSIALANAERYSSALLSVSLLWGVRTPVLGFVPRPEFVYL